MKKATTTAEHIYTRAEIRNMFKKLNTHANTVQEWWAFIADVKAAGYNDLLIDVTTDYRLAEDRLRNYTNSPLFRNKIRKYCNRVAGGDSYPYEVVEVLSPKRVKIVRMEYRYNKLTDNYDYTTTTDNNTAFEIKLTKNGWDKGQHVMSDKPCYKQDPHF